MAKLSSLARISDPSGAINDDRVGHRGNLAWVIDGATDVLEARILPGGSDAAWFAETLSLAFDDLGDTGDRPLTDVLADVTSRLARSFSASALRAPRHIHEHPSAAGILVRLRGDALDYLSLADCQLVLRRPSEEPVVLGVDPELEAGDRRTVADMRQFQAETGSRHWRDARAHMLPRIREKRGRLNQANGYGVFSITVPPPDLIRHGTVAAPKGTRLLLASDGFTRLADVFARCRAADLLGLACEQGLTAMLAELRSLEEADGQCLAHPRTKPKDDASAILLEIVD